MMSGSLSRSRLVFPVCSTISSVMRLKQVGSDSSVSFPRQTVGCLANEHVHAWSVVYDNHPGKGSLPFR